MSAPGTIHDSFFKLLMSEPATAGLFLRERLPPAVTALLSDAPPELAPYLPAFLSALKYVMRADPPAGIDVVLRETVTLDLVDVQLVLIYIDRGPVTVEPEAVRAALRRPIPEREEEIMGAITQPFYEAGVKDGLLAGKAEGKADALLRLLTRRFGPVPESVRQRIAAADLAVLDGWFAAAFDAQSLDTLFPPSASH